MVSVQNGGTKGRKESSGKGGDISPKGRETVRAENPGGV